MLLLNLLLQLLELRACAAQSAGFIIEDARKEMSEGQRKRPTAWRRSYCTHFSAAADETAAAPPCSGSGADLQDAQAAAVRRRRRRRRCAQVAPQRTGGVQRSGSSASGRRSSGCGTAGSSSRHRASSIAPPPLALLYCMPELRRVTTGDRAQHQQAAALDCVLLPMYPP